MKLAAENYASKFTAGEYIAPVNLLNLSILIKLLQSFIFYSQICPWLERSPS